MATIKATRTQNSATRGLFGTRQHSYNSLIILVPPTTFQSRISHVISLKPDPQLSHNGGSQVLELWCRLF